jgi:hypothetical protein
VKGLLEVLKKVTYKGCNVVALVDVGQCELAKKKYDIKVEEEDAGLTPAHYLDGLGLKKLTLALDEQVLVMLSSPPPFWHLPFFTILYNAAFGEALSQETIEKNLHLP